MRSSLFLWAKEAPTTTRYNYTRYSILSKKVEMRTSVSTFVLTRNQTVLHVNKNGRKIRTSCGASMRRKAPFNWFNPMLQQKLFYCTNSGTRILSIVFNSDNSKSLRVLGPLCCFRRALRVFVQYNVVYMTTTHTYFGCFLTVSQSMTIPPH